MTITQDVALAEEGFVEIDGETFYGIPNIDRMDPFLMSIISDGDHWMYVSSSGGLTAGRSDANSALFPYETDDRLHLAAGHTGPVTLIRTAGGEVWEPFRGSRTLGVTRNLYKSAVGNQLLFEEINGPLGLTFTYRWANSERFGFVRTSSLTNTGSQPVSLTILDGLANVLAHGLEPATYQAMSNLTNAYKRSELIDADARLAVYSLESRVSDRPEPAEALTATVAWSYGMSAASVSLDLGEVARFRAGRASDPVRLMTGRPAAYLLESEQIVGPGETARWSIVADVARDQGQVADLARFLQSTDPELEVADSIERGSEALVSLLTGADARQHTGDSMASVHHYANVAFNTMRGGIFVSATDIDREEFVAFVQARNRGVAARHEAMLADLPAQVDRGDLIEQVRGIDDPQLTRLTLGYLPLTFSRRHGDPSRPWNAFSIRVQDETGHRVLHYEGNWRDIFQNWEALCMSYPQYLPGVVSVFLNASTADGFNPYRITSEGIDWEEPEPDNPWSNIGYWGDHQIVYLHRLLDLVERFDPAVMATLLGQKVFAYANVPYRIAPFDSIVQDPHSTINYDFAEAENIMSLVESIGQDGKLMMSDTSDVHLVTMIEKLVVPALAKLSNFVPGGGIWMNTQRPEWNDANNALVGNGLSMVTAFYLRRHLDNLVQLFDRVSTPEVDLSNEVAEWAAALGEVLRDNLDVLDGNLDDARRRSVVDGLGRAFSDYRASIYSSGFTGTGPVDIATIQSLFELAIRYLDDTIERNRRSDGLYNSYNLADFTGSEDTARVEHLEAMLEGQVAALSSGLLQAEEKIAVLEALFASAMYRPDQNSFMLYPPRVLPSFLSKNIIADDVVAANPLLTALVASGSSSVIEVDGDGTHRFGHQCINHRALQVELDRLAQDDRWRDLVASGRDAVAQIYESVFKHHAYTGRSGSMYGYEGIGSIYWHMVAKLLVAVQESIIEAQQAEVDPGTIARLVVFYWRIRSGLGFEKTALEFGAFPMDPYSHTPAHAGAKQPGMTGQVKEEILTRPLELALRIDDGQITFDPVLLRAGEFIATAGEWSCELPGGEFTELQLPPDSLVFTVCQVPVIVSLSPAAAAIDVERADGAHVRTEGLVLDRQTSQAIFERRGEIVAVRVTMPRGRIGGA